MDVLFNFLGLVLVLFLIVRFGAVVRFIRNLACFLRWWGADRREAASLRKKKIKIFQPFGLKMFVGRQGAGKTVGMVWLLEEMRKEYPKARIYTNFDYKHQTAPLRSLDDLLTYKNGTDGVVFAIDELQNEFSCNQSKQFPETLLGVITQQRKQRICILATSQTFSRVAKPLREQCFEVIECRTFGGRWTRLKAFDAEDYNAIVDSTSLDKRRKVAKLWKKSFIQSDELRRAYDTYAVVQRMARVRAEAINDRNRLWEALGV